MVIHGIGKKILLPSRSVTPFWVMVLELLL